MADIDDLRRRFSGGPDLPEETGPPPVRVRFTEFDCPVVLEAFGDQGWLASGSVWWKRAGTRAMSPTTDSIELLLVWKSDSSESTANFALEAVPGGMPIVSIPEFDALAFEPSSADEARCLQFAKLARGWPEGTRLRRTGDHDATPLGPAEAWELTHGVHLGRFSLRSPRRAEWPPAFPGCSWMAPRKVLIEAELELGRIGIRLGAADVRRAEAMEVSAGGRRFPLVGNQFTARVTSFRNQGRTFDVTKAERSPLGDNFWLVEGLERLKGASPDALDKLKITVQDHLVDDILGDDVAGEYRIGVVGGNWVRLDENADESAPAVIVLNVRSQSDVDAELRRRIKGVSPDSLVIDDPLHEASPPADGHEWWRALEKGHPPPPYIATFVANWTGRGRVGRSVIGVRRLDTRRSDADNVRDAWVIVDTYVDAGNWHWTLRGPDGTEDDVAIPQAEVAGAHQALERNGGEWRCKVSSAWNHDEEVNLIVLSKDETAAFGRHIEGFLKPISTSVFHDYEALVRSHRASETAGEWVRFTCVRYEGVTWDIVGRVSGGDHQVLTIARPDGEKTRLEIPDAEFQAALRALGDEAGDWFCVGKIRAKKAPGEPVERVERPDPVALIVESKEWAERLVGARMSRPKLPGVKLDDVAKAAAAIGMALPSLPSFPDLAPPPAGEKASPFEPLSPAEIARFVAEATGAPTVEPFPDAHSPAVLGVDLAVGEDESAVALVIAGELTTVAGVPSLPAETRAAPESDDDPEVEAPAEESPTGMKEVEVASASDLARLGRPLSFRDNCPRCRKVVAFCDCP